MAGDGDLRWRKAFVWHGGGWHFCLFQEDYQQPISMHVGSLCPCLLPLLPYLCFGYSLHHPCACNSSFFIGINLCVCLSRISSSGNGSPLSNFSEMVIGDPQGGGSWRNYMFSLVSYLSLPIVHLRGYICSSLLFRIPFKFFLFFQAIHACITLLDSVIFQL